MASFIPNRRVLYVDDEPGLLSAFTSLMRKEKFETTVLQDSLKIEETLISKGPFAVVFSDQRMPGLDGVGVLETVGRVHPRSMRAMVTGYADHKDTLRAINVGGIAHYLEKPWKDEEFLALARDLVNKYNLTEENQFLAEELKASNTQLEQVLEGTVAGAVRLLGDLVGYINEEAAARSARIRGLGNSVLDMMTEVQPAERWQIMRALDLCYLGVAVVPPWIQVTLNKQGLASLDRFPAVQNYHLIAGSLLKDIPRFEEVARIITLQGKNFDGTGEPSKELVKGTDIPLGARLLHILTDVERLSSAHFKAQDLLKTMKNQPKKYDVALVSRILELLQPRTSDMVEAALELKELKSGMVILDDVKTVGEQVLLRSGATLTDTAIGILRHWHRSDPILGPLRVRVNKVPIPVPSS